MPKKIFIKATLKENVNKAFRIKSKLFNIIHRNTDIKKYPVIINNFNRLEYLQRQVEWLRSVGQLNIHIIDNASTYEPLLAYYKKVPATIYMLDRNAGHESLWRTHIHQRLGNSYHVYTDPDVLPDDETPVDFMYYFKSLLDKYPAIQKTGFGLRTDDLPDHYPEKEKVIKWESQFYVNPVEPGVYKAKIDTTFSLYRPGAFLQCWDDTLRTSAPYVLRHMPWYEDPRFPSAETSHYLEKSTAASSWYATLKGENKLYYD